MSWTHQFDEDFAVKYGLHEAIVFEKIRQWIRHNVANRQNYHDGRYWTFNTKKAWQEQLPFLTEKQVRVALDNLRQCNLLTTGNYNAHTWDRTLWYALTDEALALEGRGEQPPEAEPLAPEGQSSTTTPPQDNSSTQQAVALRAPARKVQRDEFWKKCGNVLTMRGGTWAAGGKEAVSLDRLFTWAKRRAGEEWQTFLRDFLDGAWALHCGKVMGLTPKDVEYWKLQPYTPSRLLSNAAAICAILEGIAERNREPTQAELDRMLVGIK